MTVHVLTQERVRDPVLCIDARIRRPGEGTFPDDAGLDRREVWLARTVNSQRH